MADELRLGGLGGEAGLQSGAGLSNDFPVPPVPLASSQAESWPTVPIPLDSPAASAQNLPTVPIPFETADRMEAEHWPSIPPFGTTVEGFPTTPIPDFYF